jgi:hypothetical protein
MVNQDSYFNLFAEPFLKMMENPGEGCKVKNRDRDPDQAVGYYGGDIGGIHQLTGRTSTITLYFGDITGVLNRLYYDETVGKFKHVRFTQEYRFPKSELEEFSNSISTMVWQQKQFEALMIAAETAPDFISR